MTLLRWKKNNNLFMVASVLGHTVFLLMMIVYFNARTPILKAGNDDEHIMSSYLVDARTVQAAPSPPTIQKQLAAPLKHAIALTRQKQPAQQQQTAMPVRASSKGQPMPELIALLHAAIQREQHYPASAQELEREGRVTLSFTLFANGTIKAPKILHSSGTDSLDHAALAAVHQAAPFQHIDRYLKSAQDYQIDVVFKLS